ncbi:MAG TPA: hypothetical protein VJ695_03950 [Nitrososphaera sp.]|nr:hypothetical protein [Nitrososphaera sp.]
MAVSSSEAEKLLDDILSANDGIIAISIMDMMGNILAAKSKESVKEVLEQTQEQNKYGGTLVVAALTMVSGVKEIVGRVKAIITIHENCKIMLLPVPSYQLLVGLVLKSSINAEDHMIANKIERLIADTLYYSDNV